MKTILLALSLLSLNAMAQISEGTYQGRTNTWLGSFTAKTCLLNIAQSPTQKPVFTLTIKNQDGSTSKREVINMSVGKIDSTSKNKLSTINYLEYGGSLKITASITLDASNNSLNWISNRVVWKTKNTVKAQCIDLVKVN